MPLLLNDDNELFDSLIPIALEIHCNDSILKYSAKESSFRVHFNSIDSHRRGIKCQEYQVRSFKTNRCNGKFWSSYTK